MPVSALTKGEGHSRAFLVELTGLFSDPAADDAAEDGATQVVSVAQARRKGR